MLGEDVDYNRLTGLTGIDFESLKGKYSDLKTASVDAAKNAGLPSANLDLESQKRQKEARDAMKTLDKYKTCDMCMGRGLVKTIYNFMSLESNCTKCADSPFEGLLENENYVDASVNENANEPVTVVGSSKAEATATCDADQVD